MAIRIVFLVLLAVSLSAGCGSDGAGPTDSCALTTRLSGGVERDVSYDDTDGCGGGYLDTERSRALAYGGLGKLLVRVIVLDTDEGAVGTFSGRVEIRDEMDQAWATADDACEIVITENVPVEGGNFANARRIIASASCTTDALPDAANTEMQPITIGPIELYSCVLC